MCVARTSKWLFAVGVMLFGVQQSASASLIADFTQPSSAANPLQISHSSVTNVTVISSLGGPVPIAYGALTPLSSFGTGYLQFSNVTSNTAPLASNRQYGFTGSLVFQDSLHQTILVAVFTNAYLKVQGTTANFVAQRYDFLPNIQTLVLASPYVAATPFPSLSITFSNATNFNSIFSSFTDTFSVRGNVSGQDTPLPPLSTAPEPTTLVSASIAIALSYAMMRRRKRIV